MSKPVFSDLFRFSGRRNRKSYALILGFVQLPLIALVFVLALATKSDMGGIAALLVLLFFYAVSIVTAAQRFNDMGWPGWFGGVMLLIPLGLVVIPVLLFAPGQTKFEQPEHRDVTPVQAVHVTTSLLDQLPPVLDPRRRCGRLAYFSVNLGIAAVTMLIAIAVYVIAGLLRGTNDFDVPVFDFVAWPISALLTVPFLIAMAQRCHDINWTGLAALLFFAPVFGVIFWLALFFIPGTPGPNRHGPDPDAADDEPPEHDVRK